MGVARHRGYCKVPEVGGYGEVEGSDDTNNSQGVPLLKKHVPRSWVRLVSGVREKRTLLEIECDGRFEFYKNEN